jgi:hypothetical protein
MQQTKMQMQGERNKTESGRGLQSGVVSVLQFDNFTSLRMLDKPLS